VDGWGDEAVDLLASVGMYLDDGQAAQVRDCLAIRDDGRWLASEVVDIEPRQNGKGVVLEARALAGPLLIGEPLVVWTAHEFKTALKAFERVRAYFDNYDHLRKRVKTIRSSTHSTEIILKGDGKRVPVGATIAWLARSGGSGRGFASVSPLILDEAYALTEEQVAAIVYAIRAAANPQVLYASSAPLKTSEVLRPLVVRGRKSARSAKPMRGFIYYEWCATGDYTQLFKLVEQNKALDDDEAETPAGQELRARLFEKVAESNRAYGTRVVDESVIRELRLAGVEQFLREGLGAFSELESGAAIDQEKWQKLADPDSRRDGDVAIGLDIAIERDWAAIGVYGKRADGLGHLQLIRYEAGTAWIIGALVELREVLGPVAVGMGRGTHASLRELLKEAGFIRPEDRPVQLVRLEGQSPHPPQRGDLAVLTSVDMAAACGQLLDAVQQSSLRHVPAQQVAAAVKEAKTRVTGETIAWARTDRSVDITPIVALTVARWAYEARINEIDDYDPAGDLY
jgi:hypothetical protein